MRSLLLAGCAFFAISAPALAQDHSHMDHTQHAPDTEAEKDSCSTITSCPPLISAAEGSGTARLPGNEGGMHGLHLPVADDWMVTDSRTVPADEVDARQDKLDAHVEAISDALGTLSTEDAQVAHAIDSALDELRATSADVDAGLEYSPPTTTTVLLRPPPHGRPRHCA